MGQSPPKIRKLLERQRLLSHQVLMYQQVMEGMRKNLKFDSLLKLVVNSVRRGLGFKRAGIFLVEPDGKHAYQALGVDQRGRFERKRSRFSIHRERGQNGISDLINGYHKYFLTNSLRKGVADREAGVTVYNNAAIGIQVGRGRIIGVLAVDNLGTYRRITRTDVERLLNYATQAGLAIESFWSHERIRTQALTDPLTGLYNRRFFDNTLTQELGRCQRYKRFCSLLLLDLDHFKRVNDRYGHDAGDTVLGQVAGLLKENTRSLDLVARIGGEEFALLLPETPPQSIRVVVRRILKVVRDMKPKVPGMVRDGRNVTTSLGLSTYRGGTVTAAQMLKAADESLYQAKRAGRDRAGKMRFVKGAK